MIVPVVDGRLPDLTEIRTPYLSDPIRGEILLRHLVNSHLEADNAVRYGLPLYDLQLAYSQQMRLPQFKDELTRRILLDDWELVRMLRERQVSWSPDEYRRFLVRTMAYGEFLGVLEASSAVEEALLRALVPNCPPVILPFSSRDELFDQCFVHQAQK